MKYQFNCWTFGHKQEIDLATCNFKDLKEAVTFGKKLAELLSDGTPGYLLRDDIQSGDWEVLEEDGDHTDERVGYDFGSRTYFVRKDSGRNALELYMQKYKELWETKTKLQCSIEECPFDDWTYEDSVNGLADLEAIVTRGRLYS